MPDWNALATRSLEGETLTRAESLRILRAPAEELLPLMTATFRVRKHYRGLKVRIHVLQNAKSGNCPEDCAFCSQSKLAATPIARYALLSKEQLLEGARRARAARAWKY